MGIPWDGTGMNCYGIGWDGTEKYVPWTSLRFLEKLHERLRCNFFDLRCPPLAVRFKLFSIPPFLIQVTKNLPLLFLLDSYCNITNKKLESIHTSQSRFKFFAFNSLNGLIILQYYLNEM